MELKSGPILIYVKEISNSRLTQYQLLRSSWIPTIGLLTDDGELQLFANASGIKGHLMLRPIVLSKEWYISVPDFIQDGSGIPVLPTKRQIVELLKLEDANNQSVLWFLCQSRQDRDHWVEALMRKVSVVATPPPSPYSEYDNWPGFPKIAPCTPWYVSPNLLPSPVIVQPTCEKYTNNASSKESIVTQSSDQKDNSYVCYQQATSPLVQSSEPKDTDSCKCCGSNACGVGCMRFCDYCCLAICSSLCTCM